MRTDRIVSYRAGARATLALATRGTATCQARVDLNGIAESVFLQMQRPGLVAYGNRYLGRGYHNYHHEFQYDYRNGVKPWQIDPTKWIIWTLSKLGFVSKLRRVPTEKILLAELAGTQRQLEAKLAGPGLTNAASAYIASAYHRLQATAQQWTNTRPSSSK